MIYLHTHIRVAYCKFPNSNLALRLRMLSDPALSDISFAVDGEVVSACRALIMARQEAWV